MKNNEVEQAERVAQRRAPQLNSFDDLRPEQMMLDADSSALIEAKQRPDCAKFGATSAFCGAYFVPVSFVARDWKVTPRRIRALLTAGRLAGRLMGNGYWEVRYPYLFALGTRGPGLKRHQRPPKPEQRTASITKIL